MHIEAREKMDWPNRYGMALFVDGEPKHAVKAETSKLMHVDRATREACVTMLADWAQKNGLSISAEDLLQTVTAAR